MTGTAQADREGAAPERGVQVLVAGAGPVGLTVANELARRGLRVRLVDAAPGPATTSRAVATHPRTLETYDQMGVVDGILQRGRRITAFTMFGGGRRLVRLDADYSTMPTRYPYTVIIAQVDTEAVLRQAVERQGVRVEWGVRLTGLRQDEGGDHVTVTLHHADGSAETCAVPWLVGCDGGHSTVRKQLGLPLIGESSETWMLADAEVDCDLPRDSIYWIHTGGQALMMVPFRRSGRWRLLDTTQAAADTPAGHIAQRFQSKLGVGLGRPITVGAPEWTSVFTFQQRMIEKMHVGRVFLAGDAAHVHSPASGQGMNTGVQEAYNLAWKLAMVELGHAKAGLLDSFSAERVPVGRSLLGSTRKATFLVQLKNSLAGVLLPVVFGVVRTVRPIRIAMQRKILGGISGLRLSYEDSPLTTGSAEGTGPAPGERASQAVARFPDHPGWPALAAELRDPRWTLLTAAGTADPGAVPAHAGEWLSVRTVGGDDTGSLPDPDGRLRVALGIEPAGWVLVRPDGYVAARGDQLTRSELDRALAPIQLTATAPVPGAR